MKSFWPKKTVQWIKDKTLYLSVPFTWELPNVKAILTQLSFCWNKAVVGGPAIKLMPNYIDMSHVEIRDTFPGVLQKINPYATRTTTGCVNNCNFCGVSKIEKNFQELKDWPNLPLLCDNNLLAASDRHFSKVIDRLKKHKWCDFNQGVDCRLLTSFHAFRFAELKNPMIRLALDSMENVDKWEKAYRKLRKAGLPKNKIRSYAIIGFDSGPQEAWKRCKYITDHGIHVSPQWYHSLKALEKNKVTNKQERLGWNESERTLIMQYYYQKNKKQKKAYEMYLK